MYLLKKTKKKKTTKFLALRLLHTKMPIILYNRKLRSPLQLAFLHCVLHLFHTKYILSHPPKKVYLIPKLHQ